MMTSYIVYSPSGNILRTGFCAETDVTLQARAGEQVIVGQANDLTHYIDNGVILERPPATEAQTELESTEQIREIRNMFLLNSDWTQLPDSPLSDEKKQLWKQYRQALRDMPAASDTIWPERPE